MRWMAPRAKEVEISARTYRTVSPYQSWCQVSSYYCVEAYQYRTSISISIVRPPRTEVKVARAKAQLAIRAGMIEEERR